ncbi:MAG: hypothetical protein ACO1OB_17335 [Archangium sp.]
MARTWNIAREDIQALMEDADDLPPAYVPSVMVVTDGTKVFTLSAWTGDMPLLFPAGVDFFVIPGSDDDSFLAREDVLALCPPVATWSADQPDANGRVTGTPSLIIDQPSSDVLEQLRSKTVSMKISRPPLDRVLDVEMLEAGAKNRRVLAKTEFVSAASGS